MQPPLRQRVGDIPLLADHFLRSLTPERPKELGAEALRILQAYFWPGNIRELQNVLRRALALSEQDLILPVDLPATLVVQEARSPEISRKTILWSPTSRAP